MVTITAGITMAETIMAGITMPGAGAEGVPCVAMLLRLQAITRILMPAVRTQGAGMRIMEGHSAPEMLLFQPTSKPTQEETQNPKVMQ